MVDEFVANSQGPPVQVGGFNTPYGIAVDGSSNVFVADLGNNKVYEIEAVNGAISSASQVIPVGNRK